MTDKRADNHPLVSVVVPVYGIERYIGACLESLIKQSWKLLKVRNSVREQYKEYAS